MDKSSRLRVGASRRSVPECTAEVYVSERVRVYISKRVRVSAGTVKCVSGELAVTDVVVMGLHSRLSSRIVGAKPSIIAAAS